MGGLSIWHLLILLVVVLLVFGTKKIKTLGEDLGGALRGFKEGMKDPAEAGKPADPAKVADKSVIDVDAKEKTHS